jgi:hypothetical protein
MKISILIPHWKTGQMTAYTIAQLLKYKGKHEIEILVVDNNAGDGSTIYLKPFVKDIKYQAYPKGKLQSHGIAFDFILPYVNTEWFITIESDSFPTQEGWLDYYEDLINKGYDSAGSLLRLSGGEYMHPCGTLYNKKVWQEAKRYCNAVEYAYFSNFNTKEGFDCHTMIHKSIVEDVMKSPYDYVELAENYKGLGRMGMVEKLMYYSPTVAPFHNGMGRTNESVKTYGQRNIESEVPNILLTEKPKIINRIGYEPGQWLTYFQLATGKKLFFIPTETKWVNGREGEQQEYTLMENGFKHIWGVSAYKDVDPNNEIAKIKQALPQQLYNSLPAHQKIKL